MSNQKTEKLGLKKSLSYGMGAIGEGTAAEAKENGVEYRVEGLERGL